MENKIREARRGYASRVGKFTQENAARFFSVSLSTYKKWEQGQGMMNGEQLSAIAAKYDVTVDYLLCRDPCTQPKHIIANELEPLERELVESFRLMTEDEQSAVMSMCRVLTAAKSEFAEE